MGGGSELEPETSPQGEAPLDVTAAVCEQRNRSCGVLSMKNNDGDVVDVDCGECVWPTSCVVGDDCPAQSLVSESGFCMRFFGVERAGTEIQLADDCGFRGRLLFDPHVRANLSSDGRIRFGNLCLSANGDNPATIEECADNPGQTWAVDAQGPYCQQQR